MTYVSGLIDAQLDAALRALWVRRQETLRQLLRQAFPPPSTQKGAIPRGDGRITPEQFAILIILQQYGHGVAVKDIAELIDDPHANVTRTLDRLEKKGLIRRTQGAADRRQVIIRLTLEGTRLAGKIVEIRIGWMTSLWGNLTGDEKSHLQELLNRLLSV